MTTVVFQPGPTDGYDTWINEDEPNTNYKSNIRLWIQSPSPIRHITFINFFLASIPVGSIVTSAKLEVYAEAVYEDPRLYLYKVIDAWYVDTLTWNNRPIQGTTPIIKEASAGNWVEFNVKEMVQEWVNDPLWNLGVQISGPLCEDTSTTLWSSDYVGNPSLRPKLTITYEPPAAGEQAARIFLSSPGITIPHAVSTLVPLDTKHIGNDYIIYLPTNCIYPVEPGYYMCTGKVGFTDIAGTCRVVALIAKNGVIEDVGSSGYMGAADMSVDPVLVYCDGVNDYIQLYAYQDNGVPRTLLNGVLYTMLSVAKVG